jgi:hypothetical protein
MPSALSGLQNGMRKKRNNCVRRVPLKSTVSSSWPGLARPQPSYSYQ